MSIGQELLDVPFGDMVAQLATAIAEGQYKMDLTSCKIAKMMGDADQCEVEIPNFEESTFGTEKVTLIGAGFQPTFYQFTDTIIEVKISIKITKSTEKSINARYGCSVAQVNASYSSKYSYSAEGSSLIRTKITPVPPSGFMQTLLDLKAQMEQKKFESAFAQLELQVIEEEGTENSSGTGQTEDSSKTKSGSSKTTSKK